MTAESRPQFTDNWRATVSGIELRVRCGRKSCFTCRKQGIAAPCGHDLMLELYDSAVGYWRPVKMELGFVLADFFYENEERLYPQHQRFMGGQYYLQACYNATIFGWQDARERTDKERVERMTRLAHEIGAS